VLCRDAGGEYISAGGHTKSGWDDAATQEGGGGRQQSHTMYGRVHQQSYAPCCHRRWTRQLWTGSVAASSRHGQLPVFIRSSPQRWPNKPGKNVRLYVHTSIHTYVRTYVCTSTIKHNAATNQIVVFVKVDETFTMIWLSRSPKVRVKVTWDLKFQTWWFSKSISYAVFNQSKNSNSFWY